MGKLPPRQKLKYEPQPMDSKEWNKRLRKFDKKVYEQIDNDEETRKKWGEKDITARKISYFVSIGLINRVSGGGLLLNKTGELVSSPDKALKLIKKHIGL